MKKLDVLIFSGEIREFFSFKRDYESIMYLIYGIDLFVLKKSFMSEVFKIV